jgi:DNA-binding beta-propeller fold protein YncE
VRQKGFIILPIIIIVILIGGVIYYLFSKGLLTINRTHQKENYISNSFESSITKIPSVIPDKNLTPTFKANDLSLIPKEVLNTKIFYNGVKTSTIYLLNGLQNSPIEIGSGDYGLSGSISLDHTKLFYSNQGIAIYDSTTNKTTQFIQDKNLPPRKILLSPNNKYIYVEYGTSPEGEGKIITHPDAITIGSSFGVATHKKWFDDNEFVYTSLHPSNLPWESGDASGISTIKIPSGEKKNLLIPDQLQDYSLIDVDKEYIFYTKETVTKEEDWGDQDKTTISYWKVDKDGNKQQINKSEIPDQTEKWSQTIGNNLPMQYARYSVLDIQPHSRKPNWLLFNLYSSSPNNGASFDYIIAIIDINNPQKTFTVLGKGISPIW